MLRQLVIYRVRFPVCISECVYCVRVCAFACASIKDVYLFLPYYLEDKNNRPQSHMRFNIAQDNG